MEASESASPMATPAAVSSMPWRTTRNQS
jgi:hypothetical protein